jgi:uncharacterized protein (TIGR02599 family)
MKKNCSIFRASRIHSSGGGGFTLVELLVSMTILVVLMSLIAQVMGQVQRAWSSASSRVSQFREARRAFDRINRNLSQATLNTYVQYVYANAADPRVPPSSTLRLSPSGYARYSELQFMCGPASGIVQGGSAAKNPGHAVFFQAPLGTNGLDVNLPTALNAVGYYVEFASDDTFRPAFLDTKVEPRFRYRLMEYRPPVERNLIYDRAERTRQVQSGSDNHYWVVDTATWSRPVAENIAVLTLSPRTPVSDDPTKDATSIAPKYEYNSSANKLQAQQTPQDYQLPPMVEVTMVAIAESSSIKLSGRGDSIPPLDFSSYFKDAKESSRQADLENLKRELLRRRVNYRIFSSIVPIRNSKWGSG